MITIPTFKNINNTYYTKDVKNLSFRGCSAIPEKKVIVATEKLINSITLINRSLQNQIFEMFNAQYIEKLYMKVKTLSPRSLDFFNFFDSYTRKYCKNREIEVNLENNPLADIADSGEACIFMMNHEDGRKDPIMLAALCTLLSEEYLKRGTRTTSPMSKVVVNQDIINTLSDKRRVVYDKMGFVGIDASIFGNKSETNTPVIMKLMKEFVKNKSHIFIFPEGILSMFKDFDLRDKFQTGIAMMVNIATKFKKSVNVVPVGFAYNQKSDEFLGSMHIGKPIRFKREGEYVLVDRGNFDLENASESYKKFYHLEEDPNNNFQVITSDGVPVKGKDVTKYILGVLCENLRICRKNALEKVPQASLKENVIKI